MRISKKDLGKQMHQKQEVLFYLRYNFQFINTCCQNVSNVLSHLFSVIFSAMPEGKTVDIRTYILETNSYANLPTYYVPDSFEKAIEQIQQFFFRSWESLYKRE